MAGTLAVRQKRKATRDAARDDSENACFTVATKDFTSWLLFSRSARAHKSERRRFTRGHRTMSCLSILSHPFSKMKSFQREKTTPLSRFVPFRTGFVQVSYRFCTSCNSFSIQIWQLFLWHLVPSIWIIPKWNNIFLLFINVSNRLNRLDCGAIRTSNGYWWSLYWN